MRSNNHPSTRQTNHRGKKMMNGKEAFSHIYPKRHRLRKSDFASPLRFQISAINKLMF